jgi:hypothetical protein
MDNDKLVTETEKRKNIETTVKEFEEYVRSKGTDVLPTIMVIYNVPGTPLTFKSQISVCNPKEEGKRSCTKRISELVADLFPVPVDERAPRAPRKPKEAKKEKNGDKGRGSK